MKKSGAAVLGGVFVLLLVFMLLVTVVFGSSSTPAPSTTGSLNTAKVPAAYQSAIQHAAQTCPEVSGPLLAAQIQAESSWNPSAVSSAGAQGIAQFLPGTWQTVGVDGDGDGKADPFNPIDAIFTQAKYMCQIAHQIEAKLGHVANLIALMLGGYNAGPGTVLSCGCVPNNPETQGYVSRITAAIANFTGLNAPPPGTTQQAPTQLTANAIAYAKTQLGVPYVFGGGDLQGPTNGGWDCSALVRWAYYRASNGSLELPRTAADQAAATAPIAAGQAQPGDLVFFHFGRLGGAVDHVGIYLGGGQMLQAPRPGKGVDITSLNTSYYQEAGHQPMFHRIAAQ